MLNNLQEKLYNILSGKLTNEIIVADSLTTKDPDYILNSPNAVGYESTQQQLSLFMNLITGYSPDTTILDIGAGRGDLYKFITELYEVPNINYYGIEQNPLLCNAANDKYNLELSNSIFSIDSSLPIKDWVVASGLYFSRQCSSEDKDLEKLINEVDLMYNAANMAVSFNLLSPIGNETHDGHFYVHPGLILDILIEKYQLVSVKHNYSNSVYTVTIYKF